MMKPVITDDPADIEPPTTVGAVKQPETPAVEPTNEQPEPTTPEEPTTPTDTIPPTVVEVGWYSDWQLTEALTAASTVRPGNTIYTKVVFSEPVRHIVADDESARPILSFILDGQTIRFHVAAHGVSGDAFQSGTCKPLHDGTDDYLCKVTIPIDTVGTITLRVGNATTDTAGNAVAEASEHPALFTVAEPEPIVEPPVVTEPEPIAEPSEPTPAPTEITLVEVGSEYTFTLEGETYPGYNPSPEVQRILNTHPSAQLPNFEEAVKMVEVVDWVYRKVWEVYPDWEDNPNSVDKRVAARDRVERQFGLTQKIWGTLFGMYFDFLGESDPESQYWFSVECYRLLLTYPERLRLVYPESEYNELLRRFAESLEKGYIVGQTNPND